ncbi:MAG: hypothetical protein ACFFDT_12670 [Candidatus Hodarchaeota archaeon]
MIFDTSKEGLLTLFSPYQATLLEHIWDINRDRRTGIESRQAHELLRQTGDRKLMRSRASVINFLNDMVEEGVLSYEDRTKIGGHYKVYFPKMDREQFAQHVVETIITKLKEIFPIT